MGMRAIVAFVAIAAALAFTSTASAGSRRQACSTLYLTAAPAASVSEVCRGNIDPFVYVNNHPATMVDRTARGHVAAYYADGTAVKLTLRGTPGRLTVMAATTLALARVRVRVLKSRSAPRAGGAFPSWLHPIPRPRFLVF
jgi:hypothetical protein